MNEKLGADKFSYEEQTNDLREKLCKARDQRDKNFEKNELYRKVLLTIQEVLQQPIYCDYGVMPDDCVNNIINILDLIDVSLEMNDE